MPRPSTVTLCFCFIRFFVYGFLAWQCRGRTCPGCRLGNCLCGQSQKKKPEPIAGIRQERVFALSAQLQFFKDRGVAIEVEALEVVEQLAAASSHSNEAATR